MECSWRKEPLVYCSLIGYFLFDCVVWYSFSFFFMETYQYINDCMELEIFSGKGGLGKSFETLRSSIFIQKLVLGGLDLPFDGIGDSAVCYFGKIYLERKEKLMNPLFLSLDLMAKRQ